MKGTLYTADFINTVNGIKLLEFNTDTGFTDSLVEHIDFEPLKNVLIDNNLSTLHIIYKPSIQENFITALSSYMSTNASEINIETTKEDAYTIYPTDVPDSETSFILRLAYNESAVFDSEYCKDNINLYKLFVSGAPSGSNSIIPFFYSSSQEESQYNYIENHINYSDSCPDFLVKYDGTDQSLNDTPGFYKLGHSSASAADRVSDFINEMKGDSVTITNYFDTSEETDYMKSIRVCNILYGSNLDNIQLFAKKVDAIFSKPKPIEDFVHDDTNLYTKFHNRHLFELATNSIKFDYASQEGVGGDVQLISGSTSVYAQLAEIGSAYKALHVPGLPDSDNPAIYMSWSLDGNTLPAETAVTESVLVGKTMNPVQFGVLSEIVIDNGSFLAGPSLPLLVYESTTDKIKFKEIQKVDPSTDKLFNATGNQIDLLENNVFVLPEDGHTFSLNFESNDTFLINETGVRIISHNISYGPPAGFYGCFVAGTQIAMFDKSLKNIEDIVQGEEVLSFNEGTKENEKGTVGELKQHSVDEVIRLTLDNENIIITTVEHPFFVEDKGWVKAGELQPLDVCRTVSGNESLISTVEVLKESHTVYNLISVSENHNFFANGILVHNKV